MFACLTLAISVGWAIDFSIPIWDDHIDVGFNSAGGTPILVTYLAAFLGTVLTIVGLIWEVLRNVSEQRRAARKKVIAIEARGLRGASGSSLLDGLPPTIDGQKDLVVVDLRQNVKDGEIFAPETAIENLVSLPTDLRRRENGYDRSDLTLVYGGLAPVPLTFLTGALLDDEGAILILDWDRHAGTWRALDGEDDGKRFDITDVNEKVPHGSDEAAMVVSVSYEVVLDDVNSRLGDVPIVELRLEDGSPNCHWSEHKQRALGQQFLNTAIALSNRGVNRIHLFLAAQNSVVFRFGKLYDKRNLPELVVYQFQRNASQKFPWGITMPVCGVKHPIIVS